MATTAEGRAETVSSKGVEFETLVVFEAEVGEIRLCALAPGVVRKVVL